MLEFFNPMNKKLLTICQPILDLKYTNQSKNFINGYQEFTKMSKDSDNNFEFLNNNVYKTQLGGTSLNTFTTIAKKNKNIFLEFIGSIGADLNGNIIKNELNNIKQHLSGNTIKADNNSNNSNVDHISKANNDDGMRKSNFNYYLEEIKNAETAKCHVMLQNNERNLFTEIGAANKLSLNFLKKYQQNIENTDLIYISTFAIHSMPFIMNNVFQNIKNQTLVVNISFEGLFKSIDRRLMIEMFHKANILIGNYVEFKSFYEFMFGIEAHDDKLKIIETIFLFKKYSIQKKEHLIDPTDLLKKEILMKNPLNFDEGKTEISKNLNNFDHTSIVENITRNIEKEYKTDKNIKQANINQQEIRIPYTNHINQQEIRIPNKNHINDLNASKLYSYLKEKTNDEVYDLKFAIFSTDSENETIFCNNYKISSKRPFKINMESFDTCGAGDYFAAGILIESENAFNENIEKVVDLGHGIAKENIIKNSIQ